MTTSPEQQPNPECVLSLNPVDRAPAAPDASPRQASSAGVDEDGPAMLLAELAQCLLGQSALAMSSQQFNAPAAGLLQS